MSVKAKRDFFETKTYLAEARRARQQSFSLRWPATLIPDLLPGLVPALVPGLEPGLEHVTRPALASAPAVNEAGQRSDSGNATLAPQVGSLLPAPGSASAPLSS